MAVYAIADLHLSHASNKPMDRFGRRWTNHTEKLDKRWRAVVDEGDTVIIPGDISWAMTLWEAEEDLRFIDRLPGRKLLLRGNHDYWWASLSKMKNFLDSRGITTLEFIQNNAYPAEDFVVAGSRGWYVEPKLQNTPSPVDYDKIVNRECQRIELSLSAAEGVMGESGGAKVILFLHFPPVFGDFICRPIVEVIKAHGVTECWFGHIHGLYNITGSFCFEGINFHLVSADFTDFYPVRIF